MLNYYFITISYYFFAAVYLPANDLLEDSPYEPVNSRLSDIFRLAPIISGKSDYILSPPHTYHTENKSVAIFLFCLYA